MELVLFITREFPEENGVSQRSGKAWRKKSYVGQTSDRYPRDVFFSVMGDNIDKMSLKLQNSYKISFDISSRSFIGRDGQERWSTDVTAWGAEADSTANALASTGFAQPAQTAQGQWPQQMTPTGYQQPAQPMQPVQGQMPFAGQQPYQPQQAQTTPPGQGKLPF